MDRHGRNPAGDCKHSDCASTFLPTAVTCRRCAVSTCSWEGFYLKGASDQCGVFITVEKGKVPTLPQPRVQEPIFLTLWPFVHRIPRSERPASVASLAALSRFRKRKGSMLLPFWDARFILLKYSTHVNGGLRCLSNPTHDFTWYPLVDDR